MRVWGPLAVALVTNLRCVSLCAGTNACAAVSIQFAQPELHLRGEQGPGLFQVERTAAAKPISSVSVSNTQSEKPLSDFDFHSRVFRSDRFYLTQSKKLPDSGVARFVDEIFTPEVVQVGKVSVSSPILTAVERKNPLSLLSGLGTDKGLLTYILLELSW